MASLGHNELTYWPSLFVVEHHREEERTSCPCVHTSFSFFFSLTLHFFLFQGDVFQGDVVNIFYVSKVFLLVLKTIFSLFAVLRDDFREQPSDTAVGIGDTATLICRGPRGVPEPRIKWKKDGQQIHPHARITVNEHGSLIIEDARKDDSGMYMCIAYNIAGSKESNAAQLIVKGKENG